MATKKNNKKNSSLTDAQKVGIGIGLTTAAVAAAGAYFLYGSPNANKNRKKVKGWMLKAKGEVLEALEKAEHMTEKEFDALIASVSKAYGKLSHVSKSDVMAFKKEMASHWKQLSKQLDSKKKAKKTAKKPAKKTSKKTAKRVAKKK